MEVRYLPDKEGFKKLTTAGLRQHFLIEEPFVKNKIPMDYSDVDRSITGSVVPSGRGTKIISIKSNSSKNPAHTSYSTKQIKLKDAESVNLGSAKFSNKKTIHKYLFPGKVDTCQPVLGLTILEECSVRNTMSAHTHQRRSEIYMFFNLRKESFVLYILGDPEETHHIIVRDRQAVLSTSWSMHAGEGTQKYSFICALGTENKDFDDMDRIPITKLK